MEDDHDPLDPYNECESYWKKDSYLSSLPFGWGTAYNYHVDSSKDYIEDLVDVNNIPSNYSFWEEEYKKCQAEMEKAFKACNTKDFDYWLDALRVAQNRFMKEQSKL